MKFILLSLFLLSVGFCQGQYAINLAGPGRTLVMPPGKCSMAAEILSAEAGKVQLSAVAQLSGVNQNSYREQVTVPVPLQAGAFRCTFDFTVPAAGLYELTVSLKQDPAGWQSLACATTYCLIAPPAEAVTDLGVQTHLGKWGNVDQLLDYVKHAGFSRIRDEIYWSTVEKTPGRFEYPERIDKMLASIAAHGLKPLIILDYGNPGAYPQHFPKNRTFPATPEARKLFLEYVRNNVERYGNIVRDWELWNEPNNVKPAVYLQLLREVYPLIHKLQPEATVISCGGGGAGGGPSAAYIAPIVANGGVDFQDAFSIHPYMAPANPDQGYGPTRNSPIKFVNVNSVGRFLENFCRKHPRSDGKLLRVWATEIGWPTGIGRNAGGESEQAAYIARTLIQHRRTGVLEALFIYDLLSDGNMHSNAEHNFGLLRNDLSPKPAFAAAAAFLRIVGNRKCTGVICDESNFKVFRFEDVLVAYAVEKNKPLTLTGIDSARVFQWDGYENGNTPIDGKLTLKLSKMPVYVKIGGKSNPQIIKDGKNK